MNDQHGRRTLNEQGRRMTDDQLVEHRLKQLEELAVGIRQSERRTDLLEVAVSRFETGLAEIRTEVRERDEHTQKSLSRLHERLDESNRQEDVETGMRLGRVQTWRTVAATLTVVAAVSGAVVGVLALFVGI